MKLNTPFKKAILILVVIVIILIVYYRLNISDCEDRISYDNIQINQGINIDSLYQPVDSVELKKIISSWKKFNVESDSFRVVKEITHSTNRKLLVVVHYTNDVKHYGAIIFPTDYDTLKRYPLLLWANGLNQFDPSVNLNVNRNVKKLFRKLNNYFIVVPSYRGQSLVVHGKSYCSDGFFGDAYDGATDDALRLLHLTKFKFAGIDEKRIAVCGVSRGGTVALLMGVRDTSINAVASLAGVTNFFTKDVYYRYGFQYKYQFLSKEQPIQELRAKMIKSSPIYFIENYPHALLLIHGKHDRTVPVSNATNVIEKLHEKESFDYLIINAGHSFDETDRIVKWLQAKN